MPLYRDEAVVLRVHKLGEADRIVTLLTKRHGRVRAVGKGVPGLVLDAGSARKAGSITVHSTTPGFTAEILAGNTLSTTMKIDSSSKVVGASTTFSLRGATARYYVLWITNLGSNTSVRTRK